MRNLICLLFGLVLLSSCKKTDKAHKVVYKISVLSGHPSYKVSYSAQNNSTKTEGPITGSWTSPEITDRKGGSDVYLTLEGGSGGSYKLYILIDGYLEQDGRMDDPYGPTTITAKISAD